MVVAFPLLGGMSALVFPLVRSVVSRLVRPDEVGTALASLGEHSEHGKYSTVVHE